MKQLKEYPRILPYNEENKDRFKVIPTDFGGETIDVLFRKGNPGLTREQCDEIRAKGGRVENFSICGQACNARQQADIMTIVRIFIVFYVRYFFRQA